MEENGNEELKEVIEQLKREESEEKIEVTKKKPIVWKIIAICAVIGIIGILCYMCYIIFGFYMIWQFFEVILNMDG